MRQFILTLVAGLLLGCAVIMGVTVGVLGLKLLETSKDQAKNNKELQNSEPAERQTAERRHVQQADYIEDSPAIEESSMTRTAHRGRVIPASANVPLAILHTGAIGAATPLEPEVIFREIIEEPLTGGSKYRWPISIMGNRVDAPLRLLGAKITVAGDLVPKNATATLKVVVIDRNNIEKIFDTKIDTSAGTFTAENLDLQEFALSNPLTIRVRRTSPTAVEYSNILHVHLPLKVAAPTTPIISKFASHQYQEPIALTSPVNSYNQFLVLSGVMEPTLPVTDFLVFQSIGNRDLQYVPRPVNKIPSGNTETGWRYELKLPEIVPNSTGSIGQIFALARAEATGQSPAVHRYSLETPVNFNSVPVSAAALPTPVIFFQNFGGAAVLTEEKAVLNRSGEKAVVVVLASAPTLANGAVALFERGKPDPVAVVPVAGQTQLTFTATEGSHQLEATFVQGAVIGPRSAPITVNIRSVGPTLIKVDDSGLRGNGSDEIVLQFEPLSPLNPVQATTANNYVMIQKAVDGKTAAITLQDRMFLFDETRNFVSLQPGQLSPGVYELQLKTTITDIFGNKLGATPSIAEGLPKVVTFTKGLSGSQPQEAGLAGLEVPGLRGLTGKRVDFPEFTEPRDLPNGFNPSDHVETRVSRLYYYRDAHRVAQIINRDARSYNRAAVDVKRQLADKARRDAANATDERRAKEREAVRAAQATRLAEHILQAEQAKLAQANSLLLQSRSQSAALKGQIDGIQRDTALPEATKKAQLDSLNAQLQEEQAKSTDLNQQVTTLEEKVAEASKDVQVKRQTEVTATESAQVKEAEEDRAREEQFRLEVAAAHEDPDTYAPGDPTNKDPVARVSVSVIGEGVIQLRGPIKGINVIRIMINEIDQPVGQVRVAVHTVQVNGERGDKMEKVLARIQKYVDHSRFLTTQSAEMLRRAVVEVASRKAAEAAVCPPGGDNSQEARDERYLSGFFGKDFLDELRSIDSEFLKTGNKLLSLHSMDTTSLSSALFLLGLAKNSTRQEILLTFQRLVQCDLPPSEARYFAAGGGQKAYGCGGKFEMFSCNSHFASLLGHFEATVIADDVMTPLQREFIRLAQIFKSRLVTELELKQRIMERGLIEERIVDPRKAAELAIKEEADAQEELKKSSKRLIAARQKVRSAANRMIAVAKTYSEQFDEASEIAQRIRGFVESARAQHQDNKAQPQTRISLTLDETEDVKINPIPMQERNGVPVFELSERDANILKPRMIANFEALKDRFASLQDIQFTGRHAELRDQGSKLANQIETTQDDLGQVWANYERVGVLAQIDTHLAERAFRIAKKYERALGRISQMLDSDSRDVPKAYGAWLSIRQEIIDDLSRDLKANAIKLVNEANTAFEEYFDAETSRAAALNVAQLVRRPLDHKKFLDMHIDDAQDKYIELLEGTRAHTANIDNYIKRLTTALDDDFNSQYYLPAFREIRNAGRLWEVQFGQIETTSILTNNRTFAKVSPQAMMEFDLPKRDIFVKEAFKGAKAIVEENGALLQDPTFLAIAKLNSGLPTSSPVSGAGATSPVRNVLPGLPGQSEEKILGQAGPGNKEFGAALEALIPDPAIYKFETGTGYEIRPVIQPDGQAVVFHLQYMYTTNMRDPVRADEKHLGRVKRHFIDTDVQLSNYELREVSRYQVALKASRTARGVPLLEDIPAVGVLFRPLPNQQSSLQQNLILTQATIFPTLFDLMGLRWAPAVADLDSLRLINDDFVVRGRSRSTRNHVFDISSSKVDDFLRIPPGERRGDLYRSQESISEIHPNGYRGPGLNLRNGTLEEGYDARNAFPPSRFIPGENRNGVPREPWHQEEMPRSVEAAPPSMPYGGQSMPLSPPAVGDPAAPQQVPSPRVMPVTPFGRKSPAATSGTIPGSGYSGTADSIPPADSRGYRSTHPTRSVPKEMKKEQIPDAAPPGQQGALNIRRPTGFARVQSRARQNSYAQYEPDQPQRTVVVNPRIVNQQLEDELPPPSSLSGKFNLRSHRSRATPVDFSDSDESSEYKRPTRSRTRSVPFQVGKGISP